MNRKNIADILCIGTQKAGTSWLHSMCNIHPKTYAFPAIKDVTSTNKEVHFWDWNVSRGIDWYRELMTPPHEDMLAMDFTPEYSIMSVDLIKRCKESSPEALVIYVLREPVERAISALRMYYFWEFGEASKDHKRISFDDDFFRIMQKSRLTELGFYVYCAEKWLNFYPNMKIINYQKIKDSPREVVLSIYKDAGIDYNKLNEAEKSRFEKKLSEKVWKSTNFQIDDEVVSYLENVFSPHRRFSERVLGINFNK